MMALETLDKSSDSSQQDESYDCTYEKLDRLLIVCDVLVHKALETLGRRLLKESRDRFKVVPDRYRSVAHAYWPTSDDTVSKVLRGSWDLVPSLLVDYGMDDIEADRLTEVLDSYTHDLAVSGTLHSRDELAYRLRSKLGLDVWDFEDCGESGDG